MIRFTLALACTFLILTAPLSAEDWSRFRGNDGQGIAASSVPTEWSSDDGLAWSVDLPGEGSSSPIVVGERIFVTCYNGEAGADRRCHQIDGVPMTFRPVPRSCRK